MRNLIAITALCAISGCGPNDVYFNQDGGAGGNTTCTLDSECPAGRLCNFGLCTPACSTDADCTSYGLPGNYGCNLDERRCRQRCSVNSDCPSAAPTCNGTNSGRFCFPGGPGTCSDSTRNGAETDVDCGGGSCGKCANGRGCQTGSDCVSGVCNASDHLCGVPDGGPCSTADVCRSGICTGGYCQNNGGSCSGGQTMCAGSCFDLQTNASHCGNCNTVCSGGQVCSNGTCTTQGGGGGGNLFAACTSDNDCNGNGFYCNSYTKQCTTPVCVSGNQNPQAFLVYPVVGGPLGSPISRKVLAVENGVAALTDWYCGVGSDVGSVTTPGLTPPPNCKRIGKSGNNVVAPCDTFQIYGSSGASK